jgi:hypothetical protein
MSQYALQFQSFDAEAYFVRRLKDHGHAVYLGVTDPDIRRERIRAAILAAKCEQTIMGKNPAGKVETYAQLFERHFNEPLDPKTRRKNKPKEIT